MANNTAQNTPAYSLNDPDYQRLVRLIQEALAKEDRVIEAELIKFRKRTYASEEDFIKYMKDFEQRAVDLEKERNLARAQLKVPIIYQ